MGRRRVAPEQRITATAQLLGSTLDCLYERRELLDRVAEEATHVHSAIDALESWFATHDARHLNARTPVLRAIAGAQNEARVMEYLRSRGAGGANASQVATLTGIRSPHPVLRRLVGRGWVRHAEEEARYYINEGQEENDGRFAAATATAG